MADKKSDVFDKPTAASTADAAKKEASRVDAAEAAKPSFARSEPSVNPPASTKVGVSTSPMKPDIKEETGNPTAVEVGHVMERRKPSPSKETEFSTKKHKYFLVDRYEGKVVPTGTWGLAIWSRDADAQEYLAFLDNRGEWWWATTTGENGVNPAVEKTDDPVAWRPL